MLAHLSFALISSTSNIFLRTKQYYVLNLYFIVYHKGCPVKFCNLVVYAFITYSFTMTAIIGSLFIKMKHSINVAMRVSWNFDLSGKEKALFPIIILLTYIMQWSQGIFLPLYLPLQLLYRDHHGLWLPKPSIFLHSQYFRS